MFLGKKGMQKSIDFWAIFIKNKKGMQKSKLFWAFLPKGKKGVDWQSPKTLMITILAILLGLALLFFIVKLRGKFGL